MVNMRRKKLWLIFQIAMFGFIDATNDSFTQTSYGLNIETSDENRNLQDVQKEAIKCKMTTSIQCKIADTGKECGTLILQTPRDCKPMDFIFTFRFCSKGRKTSDKTIPRIDQTYGL